MVEHDEPVMPLGHAPRIHGREILDEGHGHRFESEIGHEQYLGCRGSRQAMQFGRHDGTHVGIARHVHDPGDVGMGDGHGRRAVAIEIVVGELRDLHEVGDFRCSLDLERIRSTVALSQSCSDLNRAARRQWRTRGRAAGGLSY